jgi:hypothetical protein
MASLGWKGLTPELKITFIVINMDIEVMPGGMTLKLQMLMW